MGNAGLRCCIPSKQPGWGFGDGGDSDDGGGKAATNRVGLAVSELFSVPGLATAYHTSVVVNGEEFFFSDSGIFTDRVLTSHQGKPSEQLDLGYSRRTGVQLLSALQPFFRPNSYDLIRKNCNSFSDCALYYLLRKRLDRKYSTLERIGQKASADLIQRFTKGLYQPNQAAQSFSLDEVVGFLDELGDNDPQTALDPKAPPQRLRPALGIGGRVTIVGLKNAEELNGQGALILRYTAVNGRWEAQLHFSGEVRSFRAENLRPAGELVLEPGDVVRIHGLTSEVGHALNGQQAEVVRYMHECSRYEVRVGENLKAIKAENLQEIVPSQHSRPDASLR